MNLQPVHIPFQKKTFPVVVLIFALIIITFFILGGLAAIIFSVNKLSTAHIFIMLFSVGFFAMIWLIGFKQVKLVISGKPILSLEDHGFTLYSMGVYVPWSEIDSFTLVPDVVVLKVKLKDPKAFLKKQKFPAKIILYLNEVSEHYILILRLKMLAKDRAREVADQFYAFLAESRGEKVSGAIS